MFSAPIVSTLSPHSIWSPINSYWKCLHQEVKTHSKLSSMCKKVRAMVLFCLKCLFYEWDAARPSCDSPSTSQPLALGARDVCLVGVNPTCSVPTLYLVRVRGSNSYTYMRLGLCMKREQPPIAHSRCQAEFIMNETLQKGDRTHVYTLYTVPSPSPGSALLGTLGSERPR